MESERYASGRKKYPQYLNKNPFCTKCGERKEPHILYRCLCAKCHNKVCRSYKKKAHELSPEEYKKEKARSDANMADAIALQWGREGTTPPTP